MISLIKNNVQKAKLSWIKDFTAEKKTLSVVFDGAGESRVELEVKPLRVVELSSLLVLPPAVNTVAEVTFIDPVLEERQQAD